MTIKVVNKYKESNHIYCGRGTPLGNPFILMEETDRDKVCDLYEDWFKKTLKQGSNKPFRVALNTLINIAKQGDLNLGCYCAPKRCHCDTIKRYIDHQLNK